MKCILLFGAGKSSTCLIDYLIGESSINNWQLIVADGNQDLAQSKTRNAPNTKALGVDIENEDDRIALVKNADLVISLLPPQFHSLVAQDCLRFEKDLLTASYVDERTKKLEKEILDKNLLFLCEMGLDPGIDHMSALELIHRIHAQGGKITSFKSHTGGLVAPESDNNPWHYKISWNPRNVILAGSSGAIYLENSQIIKIPYKDLFGQIQEVSVPGLPKLAFYPNRNSLAYIPVYKLQEAETFIRTTLRHPDFCKAWKSIVDAGLTDDRKTLQTLGLTFKKWSQPITAFLNSEIIRQLEYLGLFEETPVPSNQHTSAAILQGLLEKKLAMLPADKDMIVMLHEIEYEMGSQHIKNQSSGLKAESYLVVKGEDSLRTAMAKTVGFPLGIAAKFILQKKITLKGLHIPILPEIYEPVLKELKMKGIAFEEKIS
jgi:saccharopine dehydrogenase-like NADP-dependent oxidoreductase